MLPVHDKRELSRGTMTPNHQMSQSPHFESSKTRNLTCPRCVGTKDHRTHHTNREVLDKRGVLVVSDPNLPTCDLPDLLHPPEMDGLWDGRACYSSRRTRLASSSNQSPLELQFLPDFSRQQLHIYHAGPREPTRHRFFIRALVVPAALWWHLHGKVYHLETDRLLHLFSNSLEVVSAKRRSADCNQSSSTSFIIFR